MTKPKIEFIESNTTGTGELFFKRAEQLGFEPVLVSDDPGRYKFLQHYRSIRVHRQAFEAYLKAIEFLNRDRGVAGVWSSSDFQAAMAARIARKMGLLHADPDALELCRDKYRCRERLAVAGLLTLPFNLVQSGKEAAAFARKIGRSVVVKPRFSAGSMGVYLCESADAAALHAERLVSEDPGAINQGVLVEGYVGGPEYSIEIFDGRAVGVTHKHLGHPPSFIEIGHEFPAAVDRHQLDALITCAEQAVAAVTHLHGPAHVEARLGPNGAFVIEINPRLAGGMIPELVRRSIGIDLIVASLQFACGLPYELVATSHAAAAVRFLVRPSAGSAIEVLGVEEALEVSNRLEVGIMDRAFGRSGPVQDFRDRLAYVVAEAEDPILASRAAEAALAKLRIRMAGGALETPHA